MLYLKVEKGEEIEMWTGGSKNTESQSQEYVVWSGRGYQLLSGPK